MTAPSDRLEDVKRRHVELILNRHKGNVTKAAQCLGLPRRSLQRMLRRYDDIDRDIIRKGGVIPHSWTKAIGGLGRYMCVFCHRNSNDIARLGDPNHCPERARQLMEDRT